MMNRFYGNYLQKVLAERLLQKITSSPDGYLGQKDCQIASEKRVGDCSVHYSFKDSLVDILITPRVLTYDQLSRMQRYGTGDPGSLLVTIAKSLIITLNLNFNVRHKFPLLHEVLKDNLYRSMEKILRDPLIVEKQLEPLEKAKKVLCINLDVSGLSYGSTIPKAILTAFGMYVEEDITTEISGVNFNPSRYFKPMDIPEFAIWSAGSYKKNKKEYLIKNPGCVHLSFSDTLIIEERIDSKTVYRILPLTEVHDRGVSKGLLRRLEGLSKR